MMAFLLKEKQKVMHYSQPNYISTTLVIELVGMVQVMATTFFTELLGQKG